jgi:hypothetical protein
MLQHASYRVHKILYLSASPPCTCIAAVRPGSDAQTIYKPPAVVPFRGIMIRKRRLGDLCTGAGAIFVQAQRWWMQGETPKAEHQHADHCCGYPISRTKTRLVTAYACAFRLTAAARSKQLVILLNRHQQRYRSFGSWTWRIEPTLCGAMIRY